MKRKTSYKLYNEEKFVLFVFVENDPDDAEEFDDDEIVNGKRGFYSECYFSNERPISLGILVNPNENIDDDFAVKFMDGYFSCLPYSRDALVSVLEENEDEISRFMNTSKEGQFMIDGVLYDE